MKKLTTWLVIALCLLSTALAKDEIVISLTEQTLYFFRNDNLVFVCPVTTGSSETPTPEGSFNILEKKEKRRSKEFDSTMLLAQMIEGKRGIFLHHGFLTEEGSHACIRLNFLSAKVLYELTRVGCEVRIVKTFPNPFKGYFKGKSQILFPRAGTFEGASAALAPFVGNRGSVTATLNPTGPDQIAINDNIVALILGEVTVTALRSVFPNVDERVKALVSLKEYKKGAMVHLVRPGKQVEGSLWFFDGGTWSITVRMEDFNTFLEQHRLRPMTEEMFEK